MMNDDFNDYFENDEVVEAPQPHVETEQEREDREIAEATIERRHNSVRLLLIALIVLLAGFLCWWVWARYFHPHTQGMERGYVMQVVSEGTLLKTFEGKLLSQRYVADTIVYESNFLFTIRDDSVAMQAKRYEGTGQRVVVTYEQYSGNLPWRGNSTTVVTSLAPDTVPIDTTRIASRRPYIP